MDGIDEDSSVGAAGYQPAGVFARENARRQHSVGEIKNHSVNLADF